MAGIVTVLRQLPVLPMSHAPRRIALVVALILGSAAGAGDASQRLTCRTEGPMSAALCRAMRAELDRRPAPARGSGAVWTLLARDIGRDALRARLDRSGPDGTLQGEPASLDVVDADRLTPGQIARFARALLDHMPPEGD